MNLKRTTGTLVLLSGVGIAAATGCSAGAEGTGETLESVSVAGSGVSGTLTFQSDWTQGYCANVAISNTGSAATATWQTVIALNQSTITSFWSATSAVSGTTLTATPLAWNAALAPGASTTFGFCANATGSNYHPTLVSVSATGSAAGADASVDARAADGGVDAASDAGHDASANDTGSDSSSVADGSSVDGTAIDARSADSAATDSASADAKPSDSASADAKPTDSAAPDTSVDTGSGGSCTWDPTVRDGTFTEYYFSQGEAQTNGFYETACGYYGTEATTNSWSSVDQVLNIANSGAAKNTYFAAIPSLTSGVWPTNDCGACIEFTGSNGAKVIATIIDECPTNGGMNPHCTEADHLDLSTSLFGATMVAGGQTNTGGDPSGGSWKFIACPITTDIVVHFNNGYTGQIYIQNMVFPVATATANGHAMTQATYGYWSASGINDLRGTTLVLTDTEGHVVTGTVPQSDNTTGASIGVQFPSPGTCSL